MKTTITELIERAEKAKSISKHGMVSYDDVIKELSNALPKEKIEIEKSFDHGIESQWNMDWGSYKKVIAVDGKDYFEKKFGIQK